jgi:hypothetical protein
LTDHCQPLKWLGILEGAYFMSTAEDNRKTEADASQKVPTKQKWQTPVYEKLDMSEAENGEGSGDDRSGVS